MLDSAEGRQTNTSKQSKPRAISTEQRERARQMMIANNRTKGDEAI